MMKRIGLIGIAVFALSVAACSGESSDIKIRNGTKNDILDVSITDQHTIWRLGNLKPGAQISFRQHLQGEADAGISWSSQGQRYSAELCYYTGGMPAKGTVVIIGESLRYRCK